MDTTAAAIIVTQEIRNYRQLGGLEKQVNLAKSQLAILNTLTEQKQQALITLMNLWSRGVTEAEIVGLINFAGRWNEQYPAGSNGNDMGANNGGGSGTNINGVGKGSNNGFSPQNFKLDTELHTP